MQPIGPRLAPDPTRRRWHWRFAGAAALSLCLAAPPVWAITIRDIIELSRAGIADEVLIELIHMDETVFHLVPADLLELKAAGVSDSVVIVMLRTVPAERERRERAEAQARLDALRVAEAARQNTLMVDGERADSSRPTRPAAVEPTVAAVPVPVAVPVIVHQVVGPGLTHPGPLGSGSRLPDRLRAADPAHASGDRRAGSDTAPDRQKKAAWIVDTTGWTIR